MDKSLSEIFGENCGSVAARSLFVTPFIRQKDPGFSFRSVKSYYFKNRYAIILVHFARLDVLVFTLVAFEYLDCLFCSKMTCVFNLSFFFLNQKRNEFSAWTWCWQWKVSGGRDMDSGRGRGGGRDSGPPGGADRL
jgi:hypothetical protein